MPKFEEWDYASVDLADNSTAIAAAPVLLKGWEVTTAASAHACPIKDGSNTITVVPASSAVGAFRDFLEPIRMDSLTVDPDDSATGNITVFYRLRT